MPRGAGIVTCSPLARLFWFAISQGIGRSGSGGGGGSAGNSVAARWPWGTERVCPRRAPSSHGNPSPGLRERPLYSGQGRVELASRDPPWPHPDGGSAHRQPGQALSPSQMEVLDEFDNEFPQSVTFCQLISEEDFERQAATCTERALRRLFRSLDRNPALAERVVRKGKQAECEQRGLLSFLWVRAAVGAARV